MAVFRCDCRQVLYGTCVFDSFNCDMTVYKQLDHVTYMLTEQEKHLLQNIHLLSLNLYTIVGSVLEDFYLGLLLAPSVKYWVQLSF